jgi:hypothetical protein
VRVTGATPGQPVERIAAPAAVADVLHDEGVAGRARVRQQQPALDGVAGVPREGHVHHVRVLHMRRHVGEHGLGALRGRGGQFAGPELVEVRGFLDGGLVVAQLG